MLQRFLCNICLLQRKDESDIAAHVQTEHESRDSDISADMNLSSENDPTSDDEAEHLRTPVKRQNRQSFRPKPSGPQRMSILSAITFTLFKPLFVNQVSGVRESTQKVIKFALFQVLLTNSDFYRIQFQD